MNSFCTKFSKGRTGIPVMHKDSQLLSRFSTTRTRGLYRVCQCGESFVSTRDYVRWCSTKCRKQFYSDRRAIANGDWRAIRKARHDMLGSHTRWEWSQKVKAMNSTCYWCGKLLTKFEVTKDHLTPVSRGGSDRIDNLVPACKKCNSKKSSKTESEYRAFLLASA